MTALTYMFSYLRNPIWELVKKACWWIRYNKQKLVPRRTQVKLDNGMEDIKFSWLNWLQTVIRVCLIYIPESITYAKTSVFHSWLSFTLGLNSVWIYQ